jgi:hypothetical protein
MSDEMSATDFDFEANRLEQLSSQQTHGLDSQLHVQFYRHAELNSHKTREAGRKIFEECVYIRILSPANRLLIIERRVTDDDKLRFAKQYGRFLDQGESLQVGTPLSEFPGLSPAQVLEMRHLKVETVEQLAGIPDTTAQLLGTGGQDLKQRAIKFLDRSRSNEELSETVRELRTQLDRLLAERSAVTEVAPKDVVITTQPVAAN